MCTKQIHSGDRKFGLGTKTIKMTPLEKAGDVPSNIWLTLLNSEVLGPKPSPPMTGGKRKM